MTDIEWVDCADPDKLAAAVAAGVRVEWSRGDETWLLSCNRTAEHFRSHIIRGFRYRIPVAVSWRLDGQPATDEASGAIPADMTPERLREMAGSAFVPVVVKDTLRRWADELEAASPDPAVPFPVGARVAWGGDEGTVIGVHDVMRWVDFTVGRRSLHVSALSPAPTPTVPVPADVVARLLATGQVSDDDRAALARAGEGE